MATNKNDFAEEHRSIRKTRKLIEDIDLICSGTLHERTKTCGKPNCRCATDPDARHGPYYEWSWRQDGRLMHKILSPEQAKLMKEAIANYGTVKKLLQRWERESAAIILGKKKRK